MEWSVTRGIANIHSIIKTTILQHYESQYEKNAKNDSIGSDGYQFLFLFYQQNTLYIFEAEEIEITTEENGRKSGTGPLKQCKDFVQARISSPTLNEVNSFLFPMQNLIVTPLSHFWTYKTHFYEQTEVPRILTLVKDNSELTLMDWVEFCEMMKRQVYNNGNQ